MRRDGNRNKNDANIEKRERIVLIVSSVLVLTALTMTGIYMKSEDGKVEDDGYVLDFTALEDSAAKKAKEIALGEAKESVLPQPSVTEDDLDYENLEVDSGKIQIDPYPGVEPAPESAETKTAPVVIQEETTMTQTPIAQEASVIPEAAEPEVSRPITEEVQDPGYVAYHGLHRPIDTEVLIPFRMDGSVYFTTLDQYKYNPALMLVATEGLAVEAATDGVVLSIYDDAELGKVMTVDAGGGFVLTYGQLQDLSVSVGSTMKAGDSIATVAAPTKYFSKEGANLYLKLTLNGTPIDPESLFQD